jgi:hypothetical protein
MASIILLVRLPILIALSVTSCSRAVPVPTQPTEQWRFEIKHVPGYMVEGIWRPCDPIEGIERTIRDTAGSGWKDGCRKMIRMGDVPIGLLGPVEGPEWGAMDHELEQRERETSKQVDGAGGSAGARRAGAAGSPEP